MYIISKNDPLPADPRKGASAVSRKYPFPNMEVGDSFYIPAIGPEELKVAAYRTQYAAQAYRRRHDRRVKFTIRRLEGRIGVWRVA